jgi:hypothetical protein
VSPSGATRGLEPIRVLALVARFKWLHIDYLHALAERVDLRVAYADEGHAGVAIQAAREGLRITALAPGAARRRALAELISATNPQVIHVLYYHHEELALTARELAPDAVLIYECRDPRSTLARAPGSAAERSALERDALQASDGQVFVSGALRTYLERRHVLGLRESSMLVPHGFPLASAAPPQRKLSDDDGQTHIALVGTTSSDPEHSRYHVEIIERLTELGYVVHSHFFEPEPEPEPDLGANEIYRALAGRNPRYHYHPTVSPRVGTTLSRLISRYDLMGVFHNLDGRVHDEADTLAVCLPTKAVCGWFHGALPVVCSRHYGGVVEQIERHGIGFTYEDWDELADLVADRPAIAAATRRALGVRARFTNEWNARELERFMRALWASDADGVPADHAVRARV